MTIEALEKMLNQWNNETIVFDLTGLIETTVKVEHAQTSSNQENITVQNEFNKEERVIWNKYQIMKVVKGEEDCILVKFDDLQMLRICRYQEVDI